jgi:hypothetical protein
VDVQDKVNALKQSEKSNAGQTTGNQIAGDQDKVAREQSQIQQKADAEIQKLWDENYRRAVSALEQNEREKIDATKQGSAARLAAIDAAIKDENAKGLQETGFYKSLLTDRVNVARQMADEEAKQKEEAGKEDASHTQKMWELELAAEREQAQLKMSSHRVLAAERTAEELRSAEQEYQVNMSAFNQELAALDKHGKDYENKLKAMQDRQTELTQAHENQITQIKDKAEQERNTRVLAAETRFNDDIARSLTSVMMRHETFAKAMLGFGDQIVAGMMENAIKSILANDMTKESDAAAAARKAYLAGMHFPFPVNIVMGPVLAAAAFASVMAFEGGGIVPGVERGDVVSARLEPGETVLPKRMTERLNSASDSGDSNRPHVHIHINHAPTIHALDSAGMERALKKNADVLNRHLHSELRKLNK